MSSLLGNPGDRWPLPQAVDALADSARRAGVPGLIWAAGIIYPSLNLSWDLVRSMLAVIEHATGIELGEAGAAGALLGLFLPQQVIEIDGGIGWSILATLLALPLLIVFSRLTVGLAKVCDPERNPPSPSEGPSSGSSALGTAESGSHRTSRRTSRRPPLRLRDAWRAGRGLGLTALGMSMILAGLLLAALLFLVGPLVMIVQLFDLGDVSVFFVGLLLPVLAVLLLYTAVLQVINQLALHSLAHNRRGVASALTHAWRLVRASPWSAARATLMDFVLFLTLFVAATVLATVLHTTVIMAWIAPILLLGLLGFAGVTRAGFWGRCYRALGGLSADDQVPGLSEQSPPDLSDPDQPRQPE
jgi:hypothetical protein